MIVLRVPNRNVTPSDFPGRYGVSQNLSCLAPVEPPYQGVRLSLPGGSLATVLCRRCLPLPWDGPAPRDAAGGGRGGRGADAAGPARGRTWFGLPAPLHF